MALKGRVFFLACNSTKPGFDTGNRWIPLSMAVLVLLVTTVTRRTAALAVLTFAVLGGAARAQTPANAA